MLTGETSSFKEVEKRPLFFGVQPAQGAIAVGVGAIAAGATWLFSSFWWMLPVFPAVAGSLFTLFVVLCAKNRHWFEFTFGGHGYKAEVFYKG